MAKAPAKPEADAPAGKSKKKLLIIVAGVVLLLVLAGGGAAFFLMKKNSAPKEKEHKSEPAKVPVFMPLEPFTVNLQSETGDKYLQVAMSLQVEDAGQVEVIKANLPQVKSRILLLLSSKDAAEILTNEGKEKLIEEIVDRVNQPFVPKGEHQRVISVFFTSFVVQ